MVVTREGNGGKEGVKLAAAEPKRRTVRDWESFCKHWDGVHNFMLAGEWLPFAYEMPPVERIVDVLRRDEEAHIVSGARGDRLDRTDVAAWFRSLPIEEALRAPFALAHYKLAKHFGPSGLLEGFGERVLEPWQQALRAAGFAWTRCYPIVFVSGPNRATNYHLDYSHVLAWQIYGTKRFVGLKDPERWAPLATRIHSRGVRKPERLAEEDELAYDMPPGTALWNAFLTPHWVEAADGVAVSVNLSHGGLRHQGKLCRHEEEVEEWQRQHPHEPKLLF